MRYFLGSFFGAEFKKSVIIINFAIVPLQILKFIWGAYMCATRFLLTIGFHWFHGALHRLPVASARVRICAAPAALPHGPHLGGKCA